MKPPLFAYARMTSAEEAVDRLRQLGDEAKLLAGGQSLVAMMNLRLARPEVLLDVSGVRGLSYLRQEQGQLRIGALTRHGQIERYPLDLGPWNLLPRASRWVGHYPIRARGTFGGSIAHADPAAEWCIIAQLLDAEVVALSSRGVRAIPADAFFLGFLTTALEPDEMVVEVRLPAPPAHTALTEFARRHGDFAIVAAAVAFDVADGRLGDVHVALGGVTDRAVRLPGVEAAANGAPADPATFREAGRAAAAAIDPPSDLHGTADYRRFLAAGLVERAFQEALADPGGTPRGLGPHAGNGAAHDG